MDADISNICEAEENGHADVEVVDLRVDVFRSKKAAMLMASQIVSMLSVWMKGGYLMFCSSQKH
jgi:3-dehydroquinate dehydratase